MQITNPITKLFIIPALEITAAIGIFIADFLNYSGKKLQKLLDNQSEKIEDLLKNTKKPSLQGITFALLNYLLKAIKILSDIMFVVAGASIASVSYSLKDLRNKLFNWQLTNINQLPNTTLINKSFNNLAILKAKLALLLKLPLDLMLGLAFLIVPLTMNALRLAAFVGITVLTFVPTVAGYENEQLISKIKTLTDLQFKLEYHYSKALNRIQPLAIKATWAISEIVFSPVTALLYLGNFIANRYKQSAAPLEADQQNSDNCELESEQTSQDVRPGTSNGFIRGYKRVDGFPLPEESEKQPLEYGANPSRTQPALRSQLK